MSWRFPNASTLNIQFNHSQWVRPAQSKMPGRDFVIKNIQEELYFGPKKERAAQIFNKIKDNIAVRPQGSVLVH